MSPPSKLDVLHRWVTTAGVMLIVMIVGVDAYEAWQDYRRALSDDARLQLATGRALAEQSARLMQEVDLVLDDVAAAYDRRTLPARLAAKASRLPFVTATAVVAVDPRPDPGGRVVSISADADPRSFVFRRRLAGSDVDTAIDAHLSTAYLTASFERAKLNADTWVLLTLPDGTVLAEQATPVEVRGAPRFTAPEDGLPPRRVRVTASDYLVVAQTVSGYPLRLVVARSLHSVLMPWIQEERSSAARTLALALLATLLLLALRFALRRQMTLDLETRRLERELAGTQRMEALGLLAASVAHDFNNVLTAIIGYAELAAESMRPHDPAAENFGRLLSATERARLLVRRVLTFDPHQVIEHRVISLLPIIAEVLAQVRATLPRNVCLKVMQSPPVAVMGDAMEIYQVIMNLCSNALHAMPDGGVLTVELDRLSSRDRSGQLMFGEPPVGPCARLCIGDSGIGLSPLNFASMFEPFYTTRQPGVGSGIGLTVVRTLLLRMKGALEVASEVGKGTRMTVYWPAVEPVVEARAGIELPHQAPVPPGGEVILVVDDEADIVRLTEEMLAALGYEPVGFTDARLALDALRTDPRRFDAILTDERMAPLRGVDFARAAHAIDSCLPIVLMTGHRDPADVAHDTGIAAIIDKPLSSRVLHETLSLQLRLAARRS